MVGSDRCVETSGIGAIPRHTHTHAHTQKKMEERLGSIVMMGGAGQAVTRKPSGAQGFVTIASSLDRKLYRSPLFP